MAMLVIETQYRENYGTPFEPYWKNKGGDAYKILDIDLNTDYNAIVEASELAYNGPMCSQSIIGWHVESDDWLSDFELSQLDYDGEILYPEPTIHYSLLKELTECLVQQS